MRFSMAVAIAASLVLAMSPSGAIAAGATKAMPGMDSAPALPAICQTDAGKAAAAQIPTMGMGHTTDADEAHFALMQGMDAMDRNMAMGSMAKNIDVAFVCGMIPHHQGAISMAQAELKYGKDPFTQKLAKGIIAAQEKEIAEMTDWLKKQSK
jgi:uncharacterized protein (DUF305 family)